jgi:hypothetical protein
MAVVHDFAMNLPPDYYPAIGEFMFRCSQLEMQMHQIAWRVFNLENPVGRILTIGTPYKAIRSMLGASVSPEMKGSLIPDKEKSVIQAINSLTLKSKQYFDLRNKIAHGGWEYPVGGKPENTRLLFVRERNQKYLATYDANLDAAYLHKQCAGIKSLNLAAKRLMFDLFELRGIPTAGNLHSSKDVR